MSKPTPGKQYTIVNENTLSEVAAKAYGDASKWTLIYKANEKTLKSSNPDLIYPGEVIIIPLVAEKESLKKYTLKNKEKDDFTLILDGLEVKVESAKVGTPIDTIGDVCSCSIAWNPGVNKELDKRVLPYRYTPAQVYLGNELILNGYLYGITPSMSINGLSKELEIFSKTIDAVDSSIKPPYEFNSVTLKQLADTLIKPLGINVVYDLTDKEINTIVSNKIFDRVTASESDEIGSFLIKIAKQIGVLVSSNVNGDILFTKARKTKPVGTLEEEQPLPMEWSAKYNGRERFNSYRVIASTPFDTSQLAIAKDNQVPRSRFKIIKADESNLGNLQQVANWERSKQLAEALTIPFPVSSWYAPNGKLWKNNTMVTVKSATLDLPKGVDLLIRNVEFSYDDKGSTAILSLCPYQVFSGENLDDIWSVL